MLHTAYLTEPFCSQLSPSTSTLPSFPEMFIAVLYLELAPPTLPLQTMSTVLSEVEENFRHIESRGWFSPEPGEEHASLFSCQETGGALGYREAAVLCLISYHNNKLHLLLTKRSDSVSTFKGAHCTQL